MSSRALTGNLSLIYLLLLAGCAVKPVYRSEIKFYEVGIASYYGEEFHGRLTSSGEIFDMNKLTAAHRVLPFETVVRVHNLENSKKVVVRINDRGPFKKGRIIDLSREAARRIDMIKNGTARVGLEILSWGKKD